MVIFSSDHGDGIGAHRWNQKSALYEEIINIPLIVTLPGKKNAGKVLPQLISNGVDFFASVCDWAGAKIAYRDFHPEMYRKRYIKNISSPKHGLTVARRGAG